MRGLIILTSFFLSCGPKQATPTEPETSLTACRAWLDHAATLPCLHGVRPDEDQVCGPIEAYPRLDFRPYFACLVEKATCVGGDISPAAAVCEDPAAGLQPERERPADPMSAVQLSQNWIGVDDELRVTHLSVRISGYFAVQNVVIEVQPVDAEGTPLSTRELRVEGPLAPGKHSLGLLAGELMSSTELNAEDKAAMETVITLGGFEGNVVEMEMEMTVSAAEWGD